VITLSYHVSHEQFSPRNLLALVQKAEHAGFDAVFTSDHLHPWSSTQGHSGFSWSWLGAALQATTRLTFAGLGLGRDPCPHSDAMERFVLRGIQRYRALVADLR
jgi:alkanesulfonate monooxygenase SsuD/methylene tetrahydromethanopterin reductase-like flavin-dependent oxidoreductase (luciferase family)